MIDSILKHLVDGTITPHGGDMSAKEQTQCWEFGKKYAAEISAQCKKNDVSIDTLQLHKANCLLYAKYIDCYYLIFISNRFLSKTLFLDCSSKTSLLLTRENLVELAVNNFSEYLKELSENATVNYLLKIETADISKVTNYEIERFASLHFSTNH